VPLSVTCTLPKDRQPTFPDRCVVCLRPQPGATTRIVAKGPTRKPITGWFSVVVPACRGCGSHLWWQATGRFLRTLLVAGVAVGGAMMLFYWLGFRDAALGGIALGTLSVAMIGLVAWEMTHPPEFKIDVGPFNVDYEFRDAEYAREFAELNGLEIQPDDGGD
jgi:hypothetical protein